MSVIQSLQLLGAGFAAGIINSVAGGGALAIFPLLLSMHINAKAANIATSIGVYGGQISSAYGYKKFLRGIDKKFYLFFACGVLGGAIGAVTLEKTSNNTFKAIAPWFIIGAVTILALQPILASRILQSVQARSEFRPFIQTILLLLALGIAIYGGYFGAGMGIVIFAVLGYSGLKNVHQINGVKNLMTITINTAANLYFIASGVVHWNIALWIFAGSAVGGFVGSKTASRLPATIIRVFVITAGVVAAIVLFRQN